MRYLAESLEPRYFLAGSSPISIMPMGDSITYGYGVPGGYRTELYQRLTSAGFSAQFVGSDNDNASPVLTAAGETAHDGVPWYTTSDVLGNLDGTTTNPNGQFGNTGYWFSGPPGANAPLYPNIILLMIGTNNINPAIGDQTAAEAAAGLDTLINEITTQRPDANLIVSSIPFVGQDYNALIPGIVAKYQDLGRLVSFTDASPTLPAAQYLSSDGVHPNAAGYQVLGDDWMGAITRLENSATSTALLSGANVSMAGQNVTFTATVSTGGSPSQMPTGSVALMDGSTTLAVATLNDADVATFTLPLVTGSHSITAIYGGDSVFAGSVSPALTQLVRGTGEMTGTSAAAPAQTDLTALGTANWSHWGDSTTPITMSGVTPINFSQIGAATVNTWPTVSDAFSWSNGTPTASASGDASTVYSSGLNTGYQLVLPADAEQRTVSLFVGVDGATGRMTAVLSDGSAAPYVATLDNPTANSVFDVYTLTYNAASAGQTLTLQWVQTNSYVDAANIGLEALALDTATVIPPTVFSPVINGDNPNGLYTAPGQSGAGVQRSMVEDVVYTFSNPVTIPDANKAFAVTVANNSGGLVPTSLIAASIADPNNNGIVDGKVWAVSLTGLADGVLASIANGEYTISINPNFVFAAADGETPIASGRSDNFFRLFGDMSGSGTLTALDNARLKTALSVYNAAFDYTGNGTAIVAVDNARFKQALSMDFRGDGFVPTI